MTKYLFFLFPLLTLGQAVTGSTAWPTLEGYAEAQWNGGESTTTYNYSLSGNHAREMYYAYYNTEAQRYLYEITGDLKYLNRHLVITQNFIDDAEPVTFDPDYLGWKNTSLGTSDYHLNGVSLDEAYYFKGVATMLRIMYQSGSALLDSNHGHGSLPGTTYRDVYNIQLAFLEEHIWNKWHANGINEINRENTHMASHWGRIGMELYIMTGTQKYADRRNYYDYAGFPQNPYIGSNLRDKIQTSGDAYIWRMGWPVNGEWQDTFHLSDIVAYMVLSEELGVYWDIDDLNALVNTMDDIIFLPGDGANVRWYMNGTAGPDGLYDISKRMRDNALLGAYDATLNDRIATQYISAGGPVTAAYGTQYFAIMARNKFLLDGNTFPYLESGTGDIPVITIIGNNPYNLTISDTYVELGAEASDTEDGDLTGSITIGGDTVDDDTEGQYFVTYDVTDSDSNPAVQQVRTVNVTSTPLSRQLIAPQKVRLSTGGGGLYVSTGKMGNYSIGPQSEDPDPGNPNPELVQNDAAAFVNEANTISGLHSPLFATVASVADATNGYGSYVTRVTPGGLGNNRRDRIVLSSTNFTNGEVYEVQLLERHSNTTGNGRYRISLGSSSGDQDNIHAAHTDWQLHAFEFTYSSGNPQIDIYSRVDVSNVNETTDYKISVKQKND